MSISTRFGRSKPWSKLLWIVTALLLAFPTFPASYDIAYAAGTVEKVVVSQAGYSANDYKVAFVVASDVLSDTTYQVLNGSTVIASGTMKDEGVTWGKRVYSIDFTSVTQTGSNYVITSNAVNSYPFAIQSNLWSSYKDEMTAFYRLQRTTDTTVAYPAGYSSIPPSPKVFHPDSYLDDAKSADGTQHYDLTGSWFDAGDYGKYGGNQWVVGSIALSYLRNATSPLIQYDNDNNGIPDLIDEAKYGSEYLIKFANQFGGAMYDIPNNSGFQHPEKATDNIPNTADDRKIRAVESVGGSAKAAGSLAATARAINYALANGKIASSQAAAMQAFADSCEAAALTFYTYAVNNQNGNEGGYHTFGVANALLFAEVELFLLTGDITYKNIAASKISTYTGDDLRSTNYWDMRPLSMAEFYPVADNATKTKIHQLLKHQADYFISMTDDTPYGVLNDFGNFGVNEPHASYLGDLLRYYELFQDPAALRAVQKGLYWIFGNNPWNISWVSGVGTDYVDFLHTRLDEQVYDRANPGVVIPGALLCGPNFRDTTNKTSANPWYEDRPLWQDDTQQWRYNEYSISIQTGLMYTIMGLTRLDGSSSVGGTVPAPVPITWPAMGDYVTGNVTVLAQPTSAMSAVDYKGAAYAPMNGANGVYSATVNTSADAPYSAKKITVRGTDSAGRMSYSKTHYTVAPQLPDPSHPLLYDDFGGAGTWGSGSSGWVNWWNSNGGVGSYAKVSVDGRSVGKFAQTPSSSSSQAKMEPWKDIVDLTGYRYLTFDMKNPGYPDARIKVSIEDGVGSYTVSGGAISVPTSWTTFNFDLDAFPNLNKAKAHLVIWLQQASGQYGEILIDEIKATNPTAGSAPTLSSTGISPLTGDDTAIYTFTATYTDADNDKPFAMQAVINGVIRDMEESDPSDTVYSDGKNYKYETILPAGNYSYYFRATDTTTDAVSTSIQSGPTVTRASVPPGNISIKTETEKVTAGISTGDTRSIFADTNMSGSKGDKLNANDVGDYMSYDISVPEAGTYSILVGVKNQSGRGKFQLSVNNANQGNEQDQYSPTDSYAELDLGTKTFAAAGTYTFKFTVTGKHASSQGYSLAFDYITLNKQLVQITVSEETEKLTASLSSGDTRSIFADTNMSNSKGDRLNANAVNDYMSYSINVPEAGTYSVFVGVKNQSGRGIFQLSIDNVNQGGPYDQFSWTDAYAETALGTKTFAAAGAYTFKFTVTGKHASSLGYSLAFDYIKLVKQ